MTCSARTPVGIALLCGATFAALPVHSVAWAQGRFVVEPGSSAGHARWLGVDGDLVAFGSGAEVTLVRGGAPGSVIARIELDRVVDRAVLADSRLWITGPLPGLASVALGREAPPSEELPLDPPVQGPLRLARADDHLFAVEDGLGLRVIRLPGHAAGGPHASHHRTAAAQEALLEIHETFSAIAVSGRRAWLAIEGGDLIVVDIGDRRSPRLEGRVRPGFEAIDLAANGETLYALDAGGTMRVLERDAGGDYRTTDELSMPGTTELDVAGRAIRFAAGDSGVTTARDVSAIAANVNISVGDSFFSPANVSINVGDTVTWLKPNTALQHNVESCDGVSDPGVCGGTVAADGLFRSGNATTASFSFAHTFLASGQNRYFCVIHSFGGMSGQVDVAGGGGGTPPPVPDGHSVPGSQVVVGRLDQAGSSLSVSWDTSCPDAVDYHIVYGFGSNLPAALGGSFGTDGGVCAIGSTSPFVWSGVPDPTVDPSRLLWWLVLANDGKGTEGSWSPDSSGVERTGPGPAGSSTECAILNKDTANSCGL
ncbi:MAG TPA: plastocyanin/azurin family copper-binding protein [Candidatus Polarisedimenticolaceae bacterium]|nr:plastocyanin/azurin family copper-binding protein [Candidatus Polarisedimenticolaceae bacterium]